MIYLLIIVILVFIIVFLYFFLYNNKLETIQGNIITLFLSRSNSIVSLYEVTEPYLEKHSEVFSEILQLRKKEFNLHELSSNLEAFLELEAKIHHEFNFIYQVCNAHGKLQKEKKFLYVREIILEKSKSIGKEIHIYNTFSEHYNKLIRYKNYTLIGLLLPFKQKNLLK